MRVSVCAFHLALWEVRVSNTNAVFATESVCVLWYRAVISICRWRCAFSHGCSLDVGATLVCVNRSIYHTGDYVRHVCAQWCSMSALVCGFQCCVYLVTVSHKQKAGADLKKNSWTYLIRGLSTSMWNPQYMWWHICGPGRKDKHLELTGLAVGALIRQSPQVFQAGLRNTDFFEILQFINMLPVYLICPLVSNNYRL